LEQLGLREIDFDGNAPGRLTKESGIHGSYLAFVPNRLPPAIELGMETIRRLADAERAIGELDGIGRLIPNPMLIRSFIRREAVSSSRIEGTVTDVEQLVLFEVDQTDDDQRDDRQEVLNYMNALLYGIDRLKTLPISLRLIREVHERLMIGVRGEDKTPGAFRTRQNMIGRIGQNPAEARFVPPPVAAMNEALSALEAYMAYPSELPVLVDLALIHYQFETIHPFLDGNGRLGRLLITLLLNERGRLKSPILDLSSYLEINKDVYMDHLLAVSRRGEWNAWIVFFLDGVTERSKIAIGRCEALLKLWERYKTEVHKRSRSSGLLKMLDKLFETPAVSAKTIERELKVTNKTAQKMISELETLGVLKEVTGKSRNRIYLASEIMKTIKTDYL
jgi:Fic family protein